MRIGVICRDYRAQNLALQPWRYVSEIVTGLRALGHELDVITDATNGTPDEVLRVGSVRLFPRGNDELTTLIKRLNFDACLVSVGLTSALTFDVRRLAVPAYGLFTSPVYDLGALLRLGLRVVAARQYSIVHLAGAITPRSLIRRAFAPLRAVITASHHATSHLTRIGVPAARLFTVPPAVDDDFREPLPMPRADQPFTVIYMGSPLPIRGVFDLVEAVAMVKNRLPSIRLRILSRGNGEYAHHERDLLARINHLGLEDTVALRSGFLDRTDLRDELAQAHMVALPFQIVPSDVPLALLESMALGRPVLATHVASMPDYLSDGRGFLAEPGRPPSLAATLLRAASDLDELSATRSRALACAGNIPSWSAVGARVSQILERVAGDGP